MNKNIMNQLMDYFIMKDFIEHNKYLPIDSRRQAMTDYQTDPIIQSRINDIVGDILKIVEENNDSLHSEKN
jgi:hypothetical protein